MTNSVPQLAALAGAVPDGNVLDGEIVAGSGRAWSFYRLSRQLSTKRSTVSFAAFDLLAIEGRPLARFPYEERRRLLVDLALVGPAWCTVPAWTGVELSKLLAAARRKVSRDWSRSAFGRGTARACVALIG